MDLRRSIPVRVTYAILDLNRVHTTLNDHPYYSGPIPGLFRVYSVIELASLTEVSSVAWPSAILLGAGRQCCPVTLLQSLLQADGKEFIPAQTN